jgi:aquaporin rerated protein, other eukaryote
MCRLSGVYYTGGSLNPARSFGPDVILHKFDGYHWIYWLGPTLGALLACAFFALIKHFQYETANPGQDFDDLEAQAFDPTKDDPTVRPVVSAHSERRLGSRGSDTYRGAPGPSNGNTDAAGARSPK